MDAFLAPRCVLITSCYTRGVGLPYKPCQLGFGTWAVERTGLHGVELESNQSLPPSDQRCPPLESAKSIFMRGGFLAKSRGVNQKQLNFLLQAK